MHLNQSKQSVKFKCNNFDICGSPLMDEITQHLSLFDPVFSVVVVVAEIFPLTETLLDSQNFNLSHKE